MPHVAYGLQDSVSLNCRSRRCCGIVRNHPGGPVTAEPSSIGAEPMSIQSQRAFGTGRWGWQSARAVQSPNDHCRMDVTVTPPALPARMIPPGIRTAGLVHLMDAFRGPGWWTRPSLDGWPAFDGPAAAQSPMALDS